MSRFSPEWCMETSRFPPNNALAISLRDIVAGVPITKRLTEQMRIAMVANIRLPADNAGARRVTVLASAFAKLGHEVTLYMPFPRRILAEGDKIPGVEFRWGKSLNPTRLGRTDQFGVPPLSQLRARLSWVRQILSAILRGEAEWIYLYHPSPEGAVFALVARLCRQRLAVEQVDVCYYTLPRFSIWRYVYVLIQRLSLSASKRLASLIIVISSRLAGQGYAKRPLIRVPALVDSERFHKGNGERLKSRIRRKVAHWVVYTGSLDAQSGISELLESMRIVIRRVPSAHLLIAGNSAGLMESPQSMIARNGLDHSAEFLGLLNVSEVIDLLALADVLVMPKSSCAINEYGFPTKVAEYLASGRPVVSTEISDIPEYMSNHMNAFLCLPGSADVLADSIIEALQTDPQVKARIAEAGRATARNCFDVNVNAKRLSCLMRNMTQCDEAVYRL